MILSEFIYKGKLLPEYCEEVGKDFDYICKIYTRKRRYSSNDIYNTEELLDIIFNNIERYGDYQPQKYYYDGMSLVEYCKQHPEYKYSVVVRYIEKRLKKDPNISVQELLDEYFSQDHINRSRYNRNYLSLRDYCEDNNINYRALLKQIHRYSTKKKSVSGNVFMALKEYCDNNGLDYEVMLCFINKRRHTLGLKPYEVETKSSNKTNTKALKYVAQKELK